MTTLPPPDNVDGPGQTNGTVGTSTQGEFGESKFGERLDYSQPKYQDLWAFILFYVHVVIIIVVGIVFVVTADPDDDNESSTPSPTLDTDDEDYPGIGGIFVAIFCALVAGILFGLLWLQCLKMFAEYIIKILIFVSIACWAVLAIIMFAAGSMFPAIVCVLMLLFLCLYAWCIWSRIPFAGACLSIASMIAQTYSGTVWIALLTVFLQFIWHIIWIFAAVAYAESTAEESDDTDLDTDTDTDEDSEGSGSTIVWFLLFISYYWGSNVWRNVSHTTTCGVTATWYFNKNVLPNPSKAAFKRTMSTSFGSVAFGSLIVAIIQALKALARSQGRSGGCLYCVIRCLEWMARYFNKYAFAQVAIYGSSYIESAKATWELFTSGSGIIKALINDDLTGMALSCGAVLGLVVAGVIGYFVAAAFYQDTIFYPLLPIIAAIVGALLGYFAVVIILLVVASGVVAIFVCFAEDPAACAENRLEAYQKLTGADPRLEQFVQERNGEFVSQP